MTEVCPRCGARLVEGLDGPGSISCPNLCVVMHRTELEALLADAPYAVGITVGGQSELPPLPEVDQDSGEATIVDAEPRPTEADAAPAGGGTAHEVAVDERLRLLSGPGGPPPAEEGAPPPRVVPPEELGVRVRK